MVNLLDTLRPQLSEAITYTAQEDRAMRPYNRFMTAVTELLSVSRMDNDAEMVFCIYAACVLEEAWMKYVVTNEDEADELRFLEILMRYLLETMKVSEGSVTAFAEEGQELVSTEFGGNIAKLATRTFRDFTDGDLKAAAGFKFFVEQMNLERK